MQAVLQPGTRRGGNSTVPTQAASTPVSLIAVFTSIVWMGCLLIGLLGILLPYQRAKAAKSAEQSIKAEVLQIDLTNDPLPPVLVQNTAALTPPPTLEQLPLSPPTSPALTAVAEPTAVAFALPVEGPVAVVEPAKASFAANAPAEAKPVVASAPVQVLTYGQGEGRQPAPEYPLRARREGQEGIVRIRFSVGEEGRVISADAVSPSPWKLLNDSALRVVRERWRFAAGALRVYEVSIHFQISK